MFKPSSPTDHANGVISRGPDVFILIDPRDNRIRDTNVRPSKPWILVISYVNDSTTLLLGQINQASTDHSLDACSIGAGKGDLRPVPTFLSSFTHWHCPPHPAALGLPDSSSLRELSMRRNTCRMHRSLVNEACFQVALVAALVC